MLVMFIPQPDIPTDLGWIHEASDWQIASTPKFKSDDIIVESRSDTVDLLSKVFEVDLEPGTTYYGRVRVICNKGIFEWSYIGVIKVSDFIKITFDHPIPSMVMKPSITLDYPVDNFPSTLFTISTSKMSTTSNSNHTDSIYIIERITGEPVYVQNTKDDLTSKLVDEVILEKGYPYIIKVAHRSSSNDVSDFASRLVYVHDVPDVMLKSDTEQIDTEYLNGIPVVINEVDDFKNMSISLYAAGIGDAKLVYSTTIDSLSGIIPVDELIGSNNSYILGISITYQNDSVSGTNYYPINTLLR